MSDQYVPALRQRFLEDMQIKGLQPKTQTMYLRGMRDFTRFLRRSPDTATPEDLRAFQLDMKERGVGAPTFNNRLTVLSFFFAATCPRPEMKTHMRYQRAAKKIPIVLSAEEVVRILEVAPGPGLKYRAAFSVAYGGGLRASEVTHLKIGDIDSDRMLIRVEQGKGLKDRQVMLSPSLLELLRDYYREARPAGSFRGATASIRSRRASATVPSGRPATLPRSRRRYHPTPGGTALPPTCLKAGLTSE